MTRIMLAKGGKAMTAEIICVGTEILLGNIVNTNAAYLAEKLAASGLDCYYQTVVGDNAERLAGVLKCAMERSDVILLSGGLGPTEDDLTKETVAKVCGKNCQWMTTAWNGSQNFRSERYSAYGE